MEIQNLAVIHKSQPVKSNSVMSQGNNSPTNLLCNCITKSMIKSTQNCSYVSSNQQNEFTNLDNACKLVSEDICVDCLEFWKIVQKVKMAVAANNIDINIKYNIKNAVEDIIKF